MNDFQWFKTNYIYLSQQEEERAKKETTSPTKLPVVIEAQEPSDEAKADQNQEPAEQKVNTGNHVKQHLGLGIILFPYFQIKITDLYDFHSKETCMIY